MIISIFLFLESIGTGELMVIMLFALLFFGSEKIPELARGLGKGMRQMKDAMNGVQTEITKGMQDVENHVNEIIPTIEPNPLSQSVSGPVVNEINPEYIAKSGQVIEEMIEEKHIIPAEASTKAENHSSEIPKQE